MIRNVITRCAIVLAAWLPFFAIWVLFAMSFGQARFSTVLLEGLSMGSASLLGIPVWYVCRHWPWPLGFRLRFYLLQIVFALVYGIAWTAAVYGLQSLGQRNEMGTSWLWSSLPRLMLSGILFYAVFSGICYAVQTRSRLHEKEALAARAEALASTARLDAIRARLNPHFLFNALHTLAALVKFRPAMAEEAIERLGDMLRYALKEDGRELVEFAEEHGFTSQYLAFEQLRYEDRLRVEVEIDPQSFTFDLPPFSIQTLAENAVHHAIALRPEGGSVLIKCSCSDGRLHVSVRDDGPGQGSDARSSSQFGLRSLRERLQAAYGSSAELRVEHVVGGFEASFVVPSSGE
jgi:LytS/YehU family sensor histidine kinase